MERTLVSLPALILLGLFLLAAGCTQGPQDVAPVTPAVTGPAPQETYTSNETLVTFVDSAAAYVKTRGTEKALAEFNNKNGSFIKGELYIYAYGFNGTTLAHPINPEKVGKNRDNEGAIGVFVREMGAEVRNGSGFYRFTYINPQHNRALESKLGYGVKIDDTWWLGSGVYTGPVNQT
jgi:cytochrome c